MKKYTKLAVLALVFILSIALTACGDISIDGGITAENEVSLTYTLEFNDLDRDSENYTELKRYLDKLKNNWEDIGCEAKVVKEDNSLTAICTMSEQCETREQAFEVLYGFMTNDISVFDSVEYAYNQGFYQEDYLIEGKIDISDIVDSSIESNYPEHIMTSLNEFYENSTFTISFSLPYNDSDTTGEVVIKEFSKEVSFYNQTDFSFSGVIKNFENAEHERQINAEKEDYEKKILIGGIASGVLLLLLLAIIILKIVKGKKKAKEGEDGEAIEAPAKLTAEEKAQAKEAAKEAKAKAKEEKAKAKEEAKAAKADAKAAKEQAKAEAEKAKAEAKAKVEEAKAEEKTEE